MSSLKVLTRHRSHLYKLIFRTITTCRVFAIRNRQSKSAVPPRQWRQSAILRAALQPERKGLMMTILLTRRHRWQEKMCHHVTFHLGSTDSDAPVLCRVLKVPLTSLIQLLNLSKKVDGGFQLFCHPRCYHSIFWAITVSCFPPRYNCQSDKSVL